MNATTIDPLNALRLPGDLELIPNCIDQETDLDAGERRAYRARTQAMAVVPRTNDDEECIGLYDVFSSSGSRYVVDHVEGRCDCPDDRNERTDGGCKHRRRVAIALDETPLPAPDADASDYWPWLLDTLHLLTAEYPRMADDGPVSDLLDGALEAVQTVDDEPAAPTPT